ncbi:class I SAM-dependent methyltransferase [Pseudonocardia ailaonensis]|uniref:Class I SAM-dependent methyltransferase n=1 Tax=Pseudonocardia ailaonensis TaxID=367279 RepID=A0ABN2NB99_9PSEU
MSPAPCRFCKSVRGEIVLDTGLQPACDDFPPVDQVEVEAVHPVQLWLCADCGLAQLVEDPTEPDEPRGVEPLALVRQAEAAVAGVAAAGLLPAGGTVVEHGSPHGGSWLGLLADRGIRETTGPADVVLDCFGLMHDADTREALERRVAELAPDGVLLVQFHSLEAVLAMGQWNAVRHGHPVYLSTPAMTGMLAGVGLTVVHAWRFDLYGGTVLLAARRSGIPDASVAELTAREVAAGVLDPAVVRRLDAEARTSAVSLRGWLETAKAEGHRIVGYSAASRAVPLLNVAGVGPDLMEAIGDASTAKHGRRIPGVRIPIVDPVALLSEGPLDVVLFVPDLLDEVRDRFPQVERAGGRWVLFEPEPRVALRKETH